MIFDLNLILVAVASVWAAWDGWRRYLAHQERCMSLISNRQDRLVKQLEEACENVSSFKTAMKTFFESMVDLIKVEEVEKQNLRNRFEAAKLGKKV